MGKKILFLFVLCFVSISGVTFAAEESPSLSGFTCSKGGFFSEEFNDEVERYKEDDANMAEKFMTSQLQNLWNIGDVNGLSTLVFGNPYCVWADNAFTDESKIEMAPDGIFTAVEREKIINPVLKMFSVVYVALMTLAMMISGLKLGFNSVRGRGISDFSEDMRMWLLSIFFIAGYGIITNMIFELNAAVVLSFKSLLEQQGANPESFSIMASWHDLVGIGSGGIPILSLLIVVLAEWILAIVLNFVYIARKVIVLVLLILGFVAGYSLLFARTRAFFGTWMRELLGNVFLQSIHALLLFGMAMFASQGASTIYKLGLMMMFIPLTGMISKWLKIGDSSSKMGSALTMVGLGGVMSTMMLTSQAGNLMRGGNMNGGNNSLLSSSSARSDSAFGGTSIAAAGGGNDASITSISTNASGASSDSWMNSKNTLSNIGGAIFGTAGMVAGPGGAIAAAKVGKSLTSALVQGPRNMVSGAQSAMNILQSAKGYNDGAGNTGFTSMMGNLGARRAYFGNMGEALGAMVGKGGAGRNIGLAMSGVSRQRLLGTSLADGGRGMLTDSSGSVLPTTMASLSRQYPGANMQYVQTNQGSSMWVQTPNQDWQQVGLTGAADPLMNNGEARVMDYQLAQANTSYELQGNGSYRARMNEHLSMDTQNPLSSGGSSINSPITSPIGGSTINRPSAPFVPLASTAIPGMNTPITAPSLHGNSAVSRLNSITGSPLSSNPMGTPQSNLGNSVSRNGIPIAGLRSNGTSAPIVPIASTAIPGMNTPITAPFLNGNSKVSRLNSISGSSLSNASLPIGSAQPSSVNPMSMITPGTVTMNRSPMPASALQTAASGSMGSMNRSPLSNTSLPIGPVQPSSVNPVTMNTPRTVTMNGRPMPASALQTEALGNMGSINGSPLSRTAMPIGSSQPNSVSPIMNSPRNEPIQGNPMHGSPAAATNIIGPGQQPNIPLTNSNPLTAASGLPGSTPHVMRTSNAYTVGVGGDGTITQNTLRTVNNTNSVRLSDTGFKADRINPDAFIAHHVPGMDNRTSGDRVADQVNGAQESVSQSKAKVKKSWSMAAREGSKERSTRIS
ncbi:MULTISPECIES: hypothetical protein [unclassified Sporosarcina]|uniref:hypothetical protein n=1 Tax=unclassified Sporosarcina TaxID=2647733 RepID=UPI001A91DA5D|nr:MULTISPECIES: hypothetical protein [unclassified Sporosarcina]MBO0588394.1 hypothetical protein [Sporosarcina sp. E16_8]MBO0601904.1 hypothetical protein [Sporosarcina sp. E16_3]